MGILFIITAFLIFIIYQLSSRVDKLENRINNLSKDLMNFKMEIRNVEVKNSEQEQSFTVQEKANLQDNIHQETIDDIKQYKQEEIAPTEQQFTSKQRQYKSEIQKKPLFIMSLLTSYFSGGNLLVRIGGVVLFFGLAFLAKYTIAHSLVSIGARVSGLLIVGIVLVWLGWKFRDKEGSYGQILQGLGVGVLYLVIFASAKFYDLIPLSTAFGIMLIVVALGAFLSYKQDSLPLALFATAGGFLVPILTSSGNGSHILLFSYYLALNIGVFAMAWVKSWRVLNLTGFIFTYAIATIWGVLKYKPALFNSTEPFLIAFFVIYLAVTILFTKKHTFKPKDYVDGTLTFGVPLLTFMFQLYLANNSTTTMALTALSLSAIYGLLWLKLKEQEQTKLLSQSFLVLSTIFATVAVPYIVSKMNINKFAVTASVWAIEATGVLWLALKQKNLFAKIMALLLLTIAMLLTFTDLNMRDWVLNIWMVFEYSLVAISLCVSAYMLDKYESDKPLSILFLSFGLLLEIYIIAIYVGNLQEPIHRIRVLGGLAIVLGLSLVTQRRLQWKNLTIVLQYTLVVWIFGYFQDYLTLLNTHNLFNGFFRDTTMLISFFSIAIMQYYMLFKYKEWHNLKLWHMATSLLIVIATYLELKLYTNGSIYSSIIPIIVGLLIIFALSYTDKLAEFKELYSYYIAGVLTAFGALWLLYSFSIKANANYLPIFNKLEITELITIALIIVWQFINSSKLIEYRGFIKVFLFALPLLFITTIVARYVANTYNLDYSISSLIANKTFEVSIAIIWSISAVILMLISKKYKSRELWIGGFSILLAVVAKLFIIDMLNSGTIERIVAFIGVGVLMLIIGYFVPMPPKMESE